MDYAEIEGDGGADEKGEDGDENDEAVAPDGFFEEVFEFGGGLLHIYTETELFFKCFCLILPLYDGTKYLYIEEV